MNRIATTVSTITASLLLTGVALAADPTVESLNARIAELETRVSHLESELNGDNVPTPPHSYTDAATLEATNNGVKTETEAPRASSTYVIKEGDSLGSIARDHNVERGDLLTANRLSEGQPIYIGETLLIPGTEPEPSVVTAPKDENSKISAPPVPAKTETKIVGETKPEPEVVTTAPEKSSSDVHVVVKGDTLTGLSRKYGASVTDIKAANGLKTDILNIGQKVVIPSKQKVASNDTKKPEQKSEFEYDNPLLKTSETYGYYTVRKGDNLYALARDFFSSMSELQRLNRLGTSTLIYPGDELIVPTSKYNAYHNSGEMAHN